MKNRIWISAFLGVGLAFGQQWRQALPGYQFQFPRDHFAHDDYETEWWYYTGNLHDSAGRRFGFELTFFRVALHLPPAATRSASSVWRPDQVYLAHLALSDLDGREFYHTERLNRAGPGLAGASLRDRQYWNGNWSVRWISKESAEQELDAVTDQLRLHLLLKPAKPPVVHGQNGVSQKGPALGQASHYISFTRILSNGTLEWRGKHLEVSGLTWMDHEFFTEARDTSLAGWDWFAIQLDNNEELMIYQLRLKSGQASHFSSGTYVDSAGRAHFLQASDFSLRPGKIWRSAQSGSQYPVAWSISVPCLNLELNQETRLENQELFSRNAISPDYWEGAVTYSGKIHSRPVTGVGYLEMTGYGTPLRLGPK